MARPFQRGEIIAYGLIMRVHDEDQLKYDIRTICCEQDQAMVSHGTLVNAERAKIEQCRHCRPVPARQPKYQPDELIGNAVIRQDRGEKIDIFWACCGREDTLSPAALKSHKTQFSKGLAHRCRTCRVPVSAYLPQVKDDNEELKSRPIILPDWMLLSYSSWPKPSSITATIWGSQSWA